jgi:hypothetical protein
MSIGTKTKKMMMISLNLPLSSIAKNNNQNKTNKFAYELGQGASS